MSITEELKKITKLMHQGNLNTALRKADLLLTEAKMSPENHLTCKITKGDVLIHLKKKRDALNILQDVLNDVNALENKNIYLNALRSKAHALEQLPEFKECLKTIAEGQKVLKTIEQPHSSEFLKLTAMFFHHKSTVYIKTGNPSLALKFIKQSLDYHKRLEEDEYYAYSLARLGSILNHLMKKDEALEYYRQSLKMFIKFNVKDGIALSNASFADICRSKGDFDGALKYYNNAASTYKEIESELGLAWCHNRIGSVYFEKGEIDLATNHYQQSISSFKKTGIKAHLLIGVNHLMLGNVFHIKGDCSNSFLEYEKSTNYFQNVVKHMTWVPGLSLYYSIKLLFDIKETQKAKEIIKKLKDLRDQTKNEFISNAYKMASALLLKQSNRRLQKAESQRIYQEIVEEPFLTDFTIDAILNLCDLLLDEFQTTGEEEALKEVKEWSNKIQKIAEKKHSYSLLIETYLLQSKLNLIELNLKKAENLLEQALSLSRDKDLHLLTEKVIQEKTLLIDQLSTLESLIEKKGVNRSEIIELTQLEDLLDRMIHKRLDHQREDVVKYAGKASKFVEFLSQNGN